MAEFTLAYESCEETRGYAILKSTFENGTEQRRKKHDRALLTFQLKSPLCTESQMQDYLDFYDSVDGELTSFTFDNPNDGETYTVRFDGDMKTTYTGAAWRVEFAFEVVA